MSDVTMVWVTVEGTIIGFLDEGDNDVAVVKVDRWQYAAGSLTWYTDNNLGSGTLPALVLRWLGNDYYMLDEKTEETVDVGDRISFTTTRAEQDSYASKK